MSGYLAAAAVAAVLYALAAVRGRFRPEPRDLPVWVYRAVLEVRAALGRVARHN
jgi:hypothetical protein